MRPNLRTGAVVLAVAIVAAACGGGDKKKATTTTTTTTSPPTTVAAPPGNPPPVPPGHFPLTALKGEPSRLGRPALIVKIDNAPKARPQAGLAEADIVIEELVEGGVTRFAVLFHSNEAADVGPVRSARSTDIHLATPLNRPLFAYSGANAVFEQLINTSPVVNVGVGAAPGEYTRRAGRPAPYNLFTGTFKLFSHAPAGSTAPPPMFHYRAEGAPTPIGDPIPTPQGGANVEYRGHIVTRVSWGWDAGAQVWRRSQDGGLHLDAAGAQVSARNVVIMFVGYRDTGLRDRSGAVVPEAELVGEGDVWVLTDGKVVKGRWKRTAPAAMAELLDGAGAPIRLTPGNTWVELPIPGGAGLF
jgi:hypothetical protein